MCKRNIEKRSRSHCCHGKELNIKHNDSVYVFSPYLTDMQIASFLHRIILSSVYSLVLPYIFFKLSPKRHDFSGGKKVKKFIDFLHKFSKKN